MTCRICLQPCDTMSECHCKGSVGYVHPDCLRRWQQASGTHQCEICGYTPAQHLPAFVCFCLGMYLRTPLCAVAVCLPFPFHYIAAGAYVANYWLI